jgi:hypothetical protein
MTRGQLLGSGGCVAGKSMPLRIRDAHDRPFSVPVFQCVLHSHSVANSGIVFGMESHSGVRKIPVEGYRGRRHIQALQVEPGAGLEPVQNRCPHLLFILTAVVATRKYYDG